ncbi:MAG: hypothetical protein ACJAZV_001248, partial [Roseivirga sp.]
FSLFRAFGALSIRHSAKVNLLKLEKILNLSCYATHYQEIIMRNKHTKKDRQ